MNKTKLSWTVSNIEKMYEDKKVLSFNHPIQRNSEMWTNLQKSLLLHSMLANYPVPSIYVLREDSEQLDDKKKPIFNYSVMDGKQRLTSVLSYLWGEFPLDDKIPNIFIEDVEYEISNKYFCDLEEAVQFEIKRYKFDIIAFEECSNQEIEEIFCRLNNSTPLTKSQVAKAKVGVDIAIILNELLDSKFFTTSCNFSKGQLKASDDQRCLIQSMMLLDTNYVPDFILKDFSETSILEYSESIKGSYTAKQSNLLKSAIQFLGDAFPESNKNLRKISVPMLIYLADVAEDNEIKPMYFRQWFEFFTEEDKLFEVYKTFCSTGSTKLEKIKGRLAVMVKSLCLYLNIEIPEELKDMLTEVEEKIAVKEETAIETVLLEENSNTKDSDEIEVTVTQDSTELEEESSELEELVSETENSNVAEENSNLEDIEQSGSEEESSDDVVCV